MGKDFQSWPIVISKEQIYERVKALGKEISLDYADTGVSLVCVLDGGAFFAMDLLKHFEFATKDNEVFLGFIKARSYANRHSGDIAIREEYLPRPVVAGRHVLIVDDIFDTGKTLSTVYEALLQMEPASIKSAVLLAKRDAYDPTFPLRPDYIGFPDVVNEWLVGYGLDDEGRYRNLKEIRICPQVER